MNEKELKRAILEVVKSFTVKDLTENSFELFNTLGYRTDRRNPFDKKTYKTFKDTFLEQVPNFSEEKAIVKDWKSIDMLFQLTKEEITLQDGLFADRKIKWKGEDKESVIETYMFFAVELAANDYSRTALAQISREINKVFKMPVMIIFKYGKKLTFSIINRRLNKRDRQKDVLEKVTLIKDILIESPHRAHVEILYDLSYQELTSKNKGDFRNFVDLHDAWQKVLDTKELNKRFYKELSNWYFWALKEVQFPTDALEADRNSVLKKDERVHEHNAKNLIRLLTRILFVWFVKEKNLIPEELFDEDYIKEYLINGFEPKKKKGFDHKTQGSKYYKAILQNLFFATLNQIVGKREFRKEKQNYNVTNLMRYESYFKDSKVFIKMVENTVPFMNGGLFECLDKENPEKRGRQGGTFIRREDGFSDKPDNMLCVPDYIFFGLGEHADLSEELDDKKQKDVAVSGLINILKSYKFTVAENTPIEEDVALDPELLGRVFENLLASYNPETKTTARKQTGSFYTPREIVNYMVDQSIKAYLQQKLEESGMKLEDADVGLEYLIGYNEKEHLFDKKQTQVLIDAIDDCKILDPACGSGAFPMGILHKLVHILHKLDPQNKLWKERQIEKANSIDDVTVREQTIDDIETAFSNNELDYGRKLFLIENCIYGVDIQPIATQISKLRFFISLIVEQKSDKAKDNFGIRPLPNLETKFVAANTLIGIEKPKTQGSLFENPEITKLEYELKNVRHRLFGAKRPDRKRKLRDEDKILREKMGDLLQDSGFDNDTARQLAEWDPYDQNASSLFFDREWMFGLNTGFDIVIGNPPYIRIQELESDLANKLKIIYSSAVGKFDIYVCFIENGMRLLNSSGHLCFINPNKFLRSTYGAGIRNYISNAQSLKSIVDFGDSQQFENATVYTCILLLSRKKNDKTRIVSLDSIVSRELHYYVLPHPRVDEPWIFEKNKTLSLINFNNKYKTLGESCEEIFQGIISGGDKLFYLEKIKSTKSSIFCKSSIDGNEYEFENKMCFNLLKGSGIGRYQSLQSKYIVVFPYKTGPRNETLLIDEAELKQKYPLTYSYFNKFRTELSSRGSAKMEYECWYSLWCPRMLSKLQSPKIVTQVLASRASYTLDSIGDYFFTGGGNAGVYGIIPRPNIDLHFLLGILNSKYHDFILQRTSSQFRGGYFSYAKRFIEKLPLIIPTNKDQIVISKLVKRIYELKLTDKEIETIDIEKEIDTHVYHLFDLSNDEINMIEKID